MILGLLFLITSVIIMNDPGHVYAQDAFTYFVFALGLSLPILSIFILLISAKSRREFLRNSVSVQLDPAIDATFTKLIDDLLRVDARLHSLAQVTIEGEFSDMKSKVPLTFEALRVNRCFRGPKLEDKQIYTSFTIYLHAE